MPVNDDQIFIDDDGGIAPIFQSPSVRRAAPRSKAEQPSQPGSMMGVRSVLLLMIPVFFIRRHQRRPAPRRPWRLPHPSGEREIPPRCFDQKPGWRPGSSAKLILKVAHCGQLAALQANSAQRSARGPRTLMEIKSVSGCRPGPGSGGPRRYAGWRRAFR